MIVTVSVHVAVLRYIPYSEVMRYYYTTQIPHYMVQRMYMYM